MQDRKKALIFGATGLVGSCLLELLTKDDRYQLITVANRSPVGYSHSKIRETIVDFDSLKEETSLFKVDEVFVCIGTTIKKAGSQAAFSKVDLDIPSAIARMTQPSSTLVLISSLGASVKSSNFYLKTKGKAEDEVFQFGPAATYAVRPSMLLGDRKERRVGESIGKIFIRLIGPLLIGNWAKYKGIYDHEVAKAMLWIADNKPDKRIFESNELKQLGK